MHDFNTYEEFEDLQRKNSKHKTVMLAALNGWNDACSEATTTLQFLLDQYGDRAHQIAHICCGSFYDYRTVRPIIANIDGERKIIWPEVTFTSIDVSPELTLMILLGPEPSFKWTEFAQECLDIAHNAHVDEIVVISTAYASTPHSRPVNIRIEDAWDNRATDNTYVGPIGLLTILKCLAVENNFPTHSLWADTPAYTHFFSHDTNPHVMLGIIEALSNYLGTQLDFGDLLTKIENWNSSIEHDIEHLDSDTKDSIEKYICELERRYDNKEKANNVSTLDVDRLVNEAENFLKIQNHHTEENDKTRE